MYLEICSEVDTPLRLLARLQIGEVTEQDMWDALHENNRYADIANFSSRPVGNEEDVYLKLMGLPPEFSCNVLEIYRRDGFLTREGVMMVYQLTARRNSTNNAVH